MNLTISQKIKYRVSAQITGAGILLGVIYVTFSNGFAAFYPFINGVLSGALIGLLIAFLELWLFTGGIRKLRFITILFLRTFLYLFLIVMILANVVAVSRMIMYGLSYPDVLQDPDFRGYLLHGNFGVAVFYSLAFAFSINFTRMISRKMGQGILVSFITGTFYTPKKQERIVMFLSLKNAGEVTSRLDELVFFRFINEYFYDITEPVISHRGIIYEYVEDLMVITWRMEKGLSEANCIRTFFAVRERLKSKRHKYDRKYGLCPEIKASLHAGSLVRAEIGSMKTQIVFHGDVMNTTARLLGKCDELGADLLVSATLLDAMDLPGCYEKHLKGTLPLKGKSHAPQVFVVTDKPAAL